ncbi:MAG: hypothetical protein GY793_04605 [Proteobacteria bacterium]|nr:hypothetical protein [Pseudomonadota bacterium]
MPETPKVSEIKIGVTTFDYIRYCATEIITEIIKDPDSYNLNLGGGKLENGYIRWKNIASRVIIGQKDDRKLYTTFSALLHASEQQNLKKYFLRRILDSEIPEDKRVSLYEEALTSLPHVGERELSGAANLVHALFNDFTDSKACFNTSGCHEYGTVLIYEGFIAEKKGVAKELQPYNKDLLKIVSDELIRFIGDGNATDFILEEKPFVKVALDTSAHAYIKQAIKEAVQEKAFFEALNEALQLEL